MRQSYLLVLSLVLFSILFVQGLICRGVWINKGGNSRELTKFWTLQTDGERYLELRDLLQRRTDDAKICSAEEIEMLNRQFVGNRFEVAKCVSFSSTYLAVQFGDYSVYTRNPVKVDGEWQYERVEGSNYHDVGLFQKIGSNRPLKTIFLISKNLY